MRTLHSVTLHLRCQSCMRSCGKTVADLFATPRLQMKVVMFSSTSLPKIQGHLCITLTKNVGLKLPGFTVRNICNDSSGRLK
jgi:hypothetical protein